MPNIPIYLPDELTILIKKEANKSKLIQNLLKTHYAQIINAQPISLNELKGEQDKKEAELKQLKATEEKLKRSTEDAEEKEAREKVEACRIAAVREAFNCLRENNPVLSRELIAEGLNLRGDANLKLYEDRLREWGYLKTQVEK